MQLELYHKMACPYSAKVRDFIADNELSKHIRYYDIEEDSEALRRLQNLSGKKQVPCLVIDGEPMFESDDIIEWLKKNMMGFQRTLLDEHGAHSGTRAGLSDYNDGGNVTHYLGNDDYPDKNNVSDAFSEGQGPNQGGIGKVAYGNNVKDEGEQKRP